MGWLKALLSSAPPPQTSQDKSAFIFVRVPLPLEPDERFEQFEAPLDAELRLGKIGEVSGGGTQLSAPDADGAHEMLWSGIDVDAVDIAAALELLRANLPELGAPAGTTIEYNAADGLTHDRFDGARWSVNLPGAPPEE